MGRDSGSRASGFQRPRAGSQACSTPNHFGLITGSEARPQRRSVGTGVTDVNDTSNDLPAKAATHYQLDVELLKALLELEKDFPDFTQFGSKASFSRRVASLLDAAAKKSDVV